MKPISLLFIITALITWQNGYCQDTLVVKGGEQLIVRQLKEKKLEYEFRLITENGGTVKSRLLKQLVDSVKKVASPADSTGTSESKRNEQRHEEPASPTDIPREKAWHFSSNIAAGLGNNIEVNDLSGNPDKNSFSFDIAWDAIARYQRAGKKIASTHELHYLFSVQKQGLRTGSFLQIAQDQLNTLQDLSRSFSRNNKWNINLILKAGTPLFTQYDGNYFRDHTGLGHIKGFASPWEMTVSPGVKFQSGSAFRLSVSPYSFNLLGVASTAIRQKGLYITDTDAAGNYKGFLFSRLGAEINCWLDKEVNDWLQMQYRLGFSANYFEQLTKNGSMDGLFITRFRLIRDLYLTHRMVLKNSFTRNFLKPYFNQHVLLSYTKSW